ncbi:MAG: 2-oxo-4-hydroxy-4-carboxy-5-ureidoimidazoline decarboxylase [Pseudomonadota bacterium]
MTEISAFNKLSESEAASVVEHWCAAKSWVRGVVAGRPFASISALSQSCADVWATMEEADLLEAYAAHPRIGDVDLLKRKYADTARAEQGQVAQADEGVITQLAELNIAYHKKFGFIFIVFASGKSAEEMLSMLVTRIENSREDELANAAAEQEKIFQNRLDQYFAQAH